MTNYRQLAAFVSDVHLHLLAMTSRQIAHRLVTAIPHWITIKWNEGYTEVPILAPCPDPLGAFDLLKFFLSPNGLLCENWLL